MSRGIGQAPRLEPDGTNTMRKGRAPAGADELRRRFRDTQDCLTRSCAPAGMARRKSRNKDGGAFRRLAKQMNGRTAQDRVKASSVGRSSSWDPLDWLHMWAANELYTTHEASFVELPLSLRL